MGIATAVDAFRVDVGVIRGETHGVRLGDVIDIDRKGASVCRILVYRTTKDRATGSPIGREGSPEVGDSAHLGGGFSAEERRAFLEYALSFRRVTDEDRKRILSLIPGLESDQAALRDRAMKQLQALGGVARTPLSALDLSRFPAETRERLHEVILAGNR